MNWLLGFKPAQIQVIKWILKLCLDRVIKFHRIWKTMKLNHSSSMSTFVKPTVWIIIHEIQFWKSVSYLLCLQICHDHNIAFTLRTYPHTDRNTIDDPHVATENIIENDMKFISLYYYVVLLWPFRKQWTYRLVSLKHEVISTFFTICWNEKNDANFVITAPYLYTRLRQFLS